jgi:hypothetical protein
VAATTVLSGRGPAARAGPGAREDREADRDPAASRPPVRVASRPPVRVASRPPVGGASRPMIEVPAIRTIGDRPTSTAAGSGSGRVSPRVPVAPAPAAPVAPALAAPAPAAPVFTARVGSLDAAAPEAFAVPGPLAAATGPAVRRGRPDLVRGTPFPPTVRSAPGRIVRPTPVPRGHGKTAVAATSPRNRRGIFAPRGSGRTATADSGRPARRRTRDPSAPGSAPAQSALGRITGVTAPGRIVRGRPAMPGTNPGTSRVLTRAPKAPPGPSPIMPRTSPGSSSRPRPRARRRVRSCPRDPGVAARRTAVAPAAPVAPGRHPVGPTSGIGRTTRGARSP